jgi:hypothetical protein
LDRGVLEDIVLIVDALGITTSKLGCSLGDGGGAKSLLLKKKLHTKSTNKRMPWLKRHS